MSQSQRQGLPAMVTTVDVKTAEYQQLNTKHTQHNIAQKSVYKLQDISS
jgi:hypothetical protein